MADETGSISINKTWETKGTMVIYGYAVDKYAYCSDIGFLKVSVPKAHFHTMFLKFLDNHPTMFPILRLLIQRL